MIKGVILKIGLMLLMLACLYDMLAVARCLAVSGIFDVNLWIIRELLLSKLFLCFGVITFSWISIQKFKIKRETHRFAKKQNKMFIVSSNKSSMAKSVYIIIVYLCVIGYAIGGTVWLKLGGL